MHVVSHHVQYVLSRHSNGSVHESMFILLRSEATNNRSHTVDSTLNFVVPSGGVANSMDYLETCCDIAIV